MAEDQSTYDDANQLLVYDIPVVMRTGSMSIPQGKLACSPETFVMLERAQTAADRTNVRKP
jgi:hypothetical protein